MNEEDVNKLQYSNAKMKCCKAIEDLHPQFLHYERITTPKELGIMDDGQYMSIGLNCALWRGVDEEKGYVKLINYNPDNYNLRHNPIDLHTVHQQIKDLQDSGLVSLFEKGTCYNNEIFLLHLFTPEDTKRFTLVNGITCVSNEHYYYRHEVLECTIHFITKQEFAKLNSEQIELISYESMTEEQFKQSIAGKYSIFDGFEKIKEELLDQIDTAIYQRWHGDFSEVELENGWSLYCKGTSKTLSELCINTKGECESAEYLDQEDDIALIVKILYYVRCGKVKKSIYG